MAIFSVNQGQANDAFNEICEGLKRLAATGPNSKTDTPLSGDKGRKAQLYNVDRTPWTMTTTEWLQQTPPRALVWEANPLDVTWSMPQRSMHTKNLYGTVLHVWPNTQRNTFYDEFRLHMNFQSGSIMPVFVPQGSGRTDNGGNWEPSGGLANFYDFMNLVDAPKLTQGTDSSPPRANLVTIQYNSALFPELTLTGMFDSNGISFTDSSQEPNQVTGWSADFIVYDSMPRFSSNVAPGQKTNMALMEIWKKLRIEKNPQVSRYRSSEQVNNINFNPTDNLV